MLIQLLVTMAAMSVLVVAWYGVQQMIRYTSPELPKDCDALEGRWGCGHDDSCVFHSVCRKKGR